MNLRDLRPANDFAQMYGVKSVVYGPPGKGKTPIINTAPRPVMLACEPGLLSMKGSNVPTYPAFSGKAIDEFFKWLFHSNETKNFDTVGVDSVSQMCEVYLQEALKNNKHGMAAYGEMARNSMDQIRGLFYMPQKHTYLIAKQQVIAENGLTMRRPYFPGQQLPTEVPHLFDEILHLDTHNVPGQGQLVAFRCRGTIDVVARDRTGNLDEFEPPDFGRLITKAMRQ